MKYFLVVAGLLIFALTSMTCHAPTEPSGSSADTTSNDWTFTVDRLGDGNSSQLFDVSIVNDTLAYAVGAVYTKDSTGQFENTGYSIAQWDGRNWRYERVFYSYQGQSLIVYPTAVYAFSTNDIWLGNTEPMRWNGSSWQQFNVSASTFNSYIRKIWGTSSNDLYIVGDNGSIAHYNGSSWQKVQSATSLNFYDIYGSGGQVLAVGSNPFSGYESIIVQLSGTNAATISDNPITGSLMGVWFVPGQQYYVVGSGVYEKRNLSDTSWSADAVDSSQTFMQGVRGNAANDLFVVGSFGQVWHFNGEKWKSYLGQTAVQNGGYGSVAVKGNLVIAVGQDNPYAVAAVGRR